MNSKKEFIRVFIGNELHDPRLLEDNEDVSDYMKDLIIEIPKTVASLGPVPEVANTWLAATFEHDAELNSILFNTRGTNNDR